MNAIILYFILLIWLDNNNKNNVTIKAFLLTILFIVVDAILKASI